MNRSRYFPRFDHEFIDSEPHRLLDQGSLMTTRRAGSSLSIAIGPTRISYAFSCKCWFFAQ